MESIIQVRELYFDSHENSLVVPKELEGVTSIWYTGMCCSNGSIMVNEHPFLKNWVYISAKNPQKLVPVYAKKTPKNV